jgi:hypothetical protein
MVRFNPTTIPGGGAAPPGALDWQNIIASNPDYMQWSLGAGERADTAQANRKAAMRALAIRFGGLPSNFADVYGDIDPETRELALTSVHPGVESTGRFATTSCRSTVAQAARRARDAPVR